MLAVARYQSVIILDRHHVECLLHVMTGGFGPDTKIDVLIFQHRRLVLMLCASTLCPAVSQNSCEKRCDASLLQIMWLQPAYSVFC